MPISDEVFSYFASHKEFCQEFLRVILQDDKLEIIDNDVQKFLPNVYFKESIIDMLCKLSDNTIVNVEIQLYKDKGHAKRIFHYASMIRQSFVDKGVKYEDIPNIIIIYLTKDDILGRGSTVYNVSMDIVSDQNENVEKWNCGLKVLYVNTKGLTNKTINEYLSQFTDKTTYITKYIETSKIKKDVFSVGGNGMTTFFKELF